MYHGWSVIGSQNSEKFKVQFPGYAIDRALDRGMEPEIVANMDSGMRIPKDEVLAN